MSCVEYSGVFADLSVASVVFTAFFISCCKHSQSLNFDSGDSVSFACNLWVHKCLPGQKDSMMWVATCFEPSYFLSMEACLLICLIVENVCYVTPSPKHHCKVPEQVFKSLVPGWCGSNLKNIISKIIQNSNIGTLCNFSQVNATEPH